MVYVEGLLYTYNVKFEVTVAVLVYFVPEPSEAVFHSAVYPVGADGRAGNVKLTPL